MLNTNITSVLIMLLFIELNIGLLLLSYITNLGIGLYALISNRDLIT